MGVGARRPDAVRGTAQRSGKWEWEPRSCTVLAPHGVVYRPGGAKVVSECWRRPAGPACVAWRAFGNALCGSVAGSSAVFVVGLSGEVHGTRRWRW